ncbi:MAG: class I SAM-dependent methyltransferase [Brevefilum sp.]
MEKDVQNQLLKINEQFYDQYAPSFSATRGRVQPGVRRLMNRMKPTASIVDVGCGNGTLARALSTTGFSGRYLGLDMSEGLLENAAKGLHSSENADYQFQQVDLAEPDWVESIPGSPYDWLVSFAVLHHIPGENMRNRTVAGFASLVSPKSSVAVSVWQWQNSPRLRKRVLPWSKVGLDPEEIDEGDVLLDWRAGETPGIRYVHTFDEFELTALASSTGFTVQDTFYSDGKTGDLALYQIWQLEQ